MSVVAGENPDVVAALEGGATYDQRLRELRRSKEIYEQAVADLRLGKEAQAAWAEAIAARDEAKALLESAKEEAKVVVERAKAEAKDVRDRARDRERVAADKEALAKSKLEVATGVEQRADSIVRNAQKEADETLARVKAAEAAAGESFDRRAAELSAREAELEKELAAVREFVSGVRSLVQNLK